MPIRECGLPGLFLDGESRLATTFTPLHKLSSAVMPASRLGVYYRAVLQRATCCGLRCMARPHGSTAAGSGVLSERSVSMLCLMGGFVSCHQRYEHIRRSLVEMGAAEPGSPADEKLRAVLQASMLVSGWLLTNRTICRGSMILVPPLVCRRHAICMCGSTCANVGGTGSRQVSSHRLIMWAMPFQPLYHVWLEHPSMWDEWVVEVGRRNGAGPGGPPADQPRKLLVRKRRWHTCESVSGGGRSSNGSRVREPLSLRCPRCGCKPACDVIHAVATADGRRSAAGVCMCTGQNDVLASAVEL